MDFHLEGMSDIIPPVLFVYRCCNLQSGASLSVVPERTPEDQWLSGHWCHGG